MTAAVKKKTEPKKKSAKADKKASPSAKATGDRPVKKTAKPETKKVSTKPAAKPEVKETKKASAFAKATVDRPAAKKSEKEVKKVGTPAPPAPPPKIKGIRIRLSAFDHTVLDETALKIIDTAIRTGAVVHGPIPLPTRIRKFTVNRSTFVHKDARDQFEMRIHRRIIDLSETTFKTVDALQNLSLPSGVDIEIRMG